MIFNAPQISRFARNQVVYALPLTHAHTATQQLNLVHPDHSL